MSMTLLRWLRRLHAWAGLALAVVVATLALSGTLLVFKADYLRAVFPVARAPADTSAVQLAVVAARADAQYGDALRSIVFGTDELGLHQAYFKDGGGAYLDAHGEVVTRWHEGGRPEVWLFDLHHDLLAGERGHTLAGITGLLVAIMAITGFVVWWPGRRAFRGRVWPRSARRRDLVTQHRDLGVIAALPIVLVALTGAAMVFSKPAQAVLAALLPASSPAAVSARADVAVRSSPVTSPGSNGPDASLAPSASPVAAVRTPPDWAHVLARAQAQFPDARLRVLAWPDDRGIVTVRLRQPAEWHPNGRTRVAIDAHELRVVEVTDAVAAPLATRAYNALYPLHAARVGGRAYDLLLVLAGLALLALSLVGATTYLMHARAPASAKMRVRTDP
jgi:uncharacterized iron-regulated membrane protein